MKNDDAVQAPQLKPFGPHFGATKRAVQRFDGRLKYASEHCIAVIVAKEQCKKACFLYSLLILFAELALVRRLARQLERGFPLPQPSACSRGV